MYNLFKMDEKSESKYKGWGIIFGLAFILLFLYVMDWDFFGGKITEYPLLCSPEYKEGNGCYTVSSTTYYPDKNKQVVIKKNEFSIDTLKKCTVIGRENWECKYDDESAVFGFNSGQFHENTLRTTTDKRLIEDIIKDDMKYRYVPRWMWLLEYWNII